jgi:hypothetical protein
MPSSTERPISNFAFSLLGSYICIYRSNFLNQTSSIWLLNLTSRSGVQNNKHCGGEQRLNEIIEDDN